jgi:methyl-accepting chemotaxis protein
LESALAFHNVLKPKDFMTQDRPDRLDRIEATLDRVAQQFDNQVVVNAELRQTTAQLQQTTAQLQESVNELTSSVSSLIGIANQHQENFMVLVTEIRDIRVDMQEMQSEIQQILTRVERLENE